MSEIKEQLRAAILTPRPLPYEDVVVPEWTSEKFPKGVSVRIQGLSAGEGEALAIEVTRIDAHNQVHADRQNFRARLVARCLVDPADGTRLLKDEEAALLSHQSGAILERLFKIAARVSGMAQNLETVKGN